MKIEYTLSKHRFYELKHFCLQYPEWKELYLLSDGWPNAISKNEGDTTSRDGIKRAVYGGYIDLIEQCAYDTDRDIIRYVTQNNIIIPSEKLYYYRKFFWELSRRKL